jgi:hypothetical protein
MTLGSNTRQHGVEFDYVNFETVLEGEITVWLAASIWRIQTLCERQGS